MIEAGKEQSFRKESNSDDEITKIFNTIDGLRNKDRAIWEISFIKYY